MNPVAPINTYVAPQITPMISAAKPLRNPSSAMNIIVTSPNSVPTSDAIARFTRSFRPATRKSATPLIRRAARMPTPNAPIR